jgi:hypothetical protein
MLAGRRYIVCRNHQEAAKDAADRAAIVAALERALQNGDKARVGNAGYRRYLKTTAADHFAIDLAKVEEEPLAKRLRSRGRWLCWACRGGLADAFRSMTTADWRLSTQFPRCLDFVSLELGADCGRVLAAT